LRAFTFGHVRQLDKLLGQALDRTQPTLLIKPGKAARMTHDYKRNGTTSLYAALQMRRARFTGHLVGERGDHAIAA